jgi:hypothetical protein
MGACGLHCILFGMVHGLLFTIGFLHATCAYGTFVRVAFHWRAITPLVGVLRRSFLAGMALALFPHSAFWCTKIILVLIEVEVGMIGYWKAGFRRGLLYLGYLAEVGK